MDHELDDPDVIKSRPITRDRFYTKLFPKKRIYREISPKFIPVLAGQSNAGYPDHERGAISSFIENLRGENGGSLPSIESIGSYSCESETCVITFTNEGDYCAKWFETNKGKSNGFYNFTK